MLDIIRSSDTNAINRLLRARSAALTEAEAVVRPILEDIRRHGDRALLRYAKKFDRLDLRQTGFTVSGEEIHRAYREVPRGFMAAVRVAAANIRQAARQQLPRPWTCQTRAGVSVGQILRPLERVACYVPGGRFPLPSTVLMSVIPAQVAGVGEVIVTSPRPAPAVLVAADLLGVKKIYRLGGAQAVAAFAFGTKSVPRVDKIVGPGNRYVAAAKKLVAGECGIDLSPDHRNWCWWVVAATPSGSRRTWLRKRSTTPMPWRFSLPPPSNWRFKCKQPRGESWRGWSCHSRARRLRRRVALSSPATWRRPPNSSIVWRLNTLRFSRAPRHCWGASTRPAPSFWARIALSPREIMPRGQITFFPPAARRAYAVA